MVQPSCVLAFFLKRLGATEQTCAERQCMVALTATSDELRKYPFLTERLSKFVGPQCFPLMNPSAAEFRVRANSLLPGTDANGGDEGDCVGAVRGSKESLLQVENW